MFQLRQKILTAGAFLAVFAHAPLALAYDPGTTHAALSDAIVDFYNLVYPNEPLTPQQKEWIVQGSIDEDTVPRWVNHFYDPVHNRSWTGEKTGYWDSKTVHALGRIGLSNWHNPLTAVDWLTNDSIQQTWKLFLGNRTWQRGLRYFADGDEEDAYKVLGHSLHLLEDMSVPEHTRNDPHAHEIQDVTGDYGSPYEEYTKRKWNRGTIGQLAIPQALKKEGTTPPERSSPGDYLKAVAEYSNKYFFTKDTINDPDYSSPKIIRLEEKLAYGIDENGNIFPLTEVKSRWDDVSKEFKKGLEISPPHGGDNVVLDAYFSRLSRKAVIEGAGMIRLFKQKSADAVVNMGIPHRLVEAHPDANEWFSFPNLAPVGLYDKYIGALQSRVDRGLATVLSSTASFVDSILGVGGQVALSPPPLPSAKPQQTVAVEPPATPPTQAPAEPAASPRPSAPETQAQETAPASLSEPQASQPQVPQTAPAPSIEEQIENLLAQWRILNAKIQALQRSDAPSPSTASASQAGGGGGGASQALALGGSTPAPPIAPSSETLLPSEDTSSSPSSSSSSDSGTVDDSASSSPALSSFTASYSVATQEIRLAWESLASSTSTSSTSSPRYLLYDVTNGARILLLDTTTSLSHSFVAREVGRDYEFELEAQGPDGLLKSETAAVTPDSLLESFSWYPDPREGRAGNYFADFTFRPRSFWDSGDTSGSQQWALIAAHVHRAGAPEASEQLRLEYQRCNGGKRESDNLLIPWNRFSCQSGSHLSSAIMFAQLEDNRVRFPAALSPPPAPGDTVTLSRYDFGGFDGGPRFTLALADKTSYRFGDVPVPLALPEIPRNLELSFSFSTMRLQPRWDRSSDPDTIDGEVRYEVAVATSSAGLAEAAWGLSLGGGTSFLGEEIPVDPSFSYLVAVRAFDDFRNTSAPAVAEWSPPEEAPADEETASSNSSAPTDDEETP